MIAAAGVNGGTPTGSGVTCLSQLGSLAVNLYTQTAHESIAVWIL